MGFNRDEFESAFWELVDERGTDECWPWKGRTIPDGRYGRYRGKLAHRVCYELEHGPIPPGIVVMHSCDAGLCVNPFHLSAGTQTENMRDKCCKGRANTSRLTPATVREIRARHDDGATYRVIATEFDITVSNAYMIANRQRFEWVEEA